MQNACGRVKSCVCSADAYVIYITWPGTPHFCVGAIRRRHRCPLLIPCSGLVPFVVDKMFLGQTFRRLRFTSPPPRCHRLRLKCDGTRAETRFRLSAKRTSPFKSAGGVSSVDYCQASCAHQPAGFVLIVQACVLQSCDAYWLPTPSCCFTFTSPPVRHRVPSHFNWTLPPTIRTHPCWRPHVVYKGTVIDNTCIIFSA
jgi:hypothetical protein